MLRSPQGSATGAIRALGSAPADSAAERLTASTGGYMLGLEEEIGEREGTGEVSTRELPHAAELNMSVFPGGVLARGHHPYKAPHREQEGDFMHKDGLGLRLALGLGLGWFGLGGCAAEVDNVLTVAATSPAASLSEPVSVDAADYENIGTPTAATSSAVSSSEPVTCDETSDETGGEHIGTTMSALTNVQRIAICQAAALVAATVGCAGITASCVASGVLTIGSVTIPCVLVIAFACAAYVGGSSVIVTYCPEYVNR